MPRISTNRRGAFSATIRVPQIAPGTYAITVNLQGPAATAAFTVSSPTTATPSPTPVSSPIATVTPSPTPSATPTSGPAPSSWTAFESAGFDGGNLTEFDSTNALRGSVSTSSNSPGAASGSKFMVASVDGGSGNAYARGQWSVAWDEGTVYRSEMSIFLPSGFYANQQGAVQLVGWDTYPTADNQMRMVIWGSDRRARLFLKSDGVDTVLTNTFAIPEGRWVRLAIEQKISNSGGWSRVYLDGQLAAQGNGDTATPYAVTRMRYGIVAIDSNRQALPLTAYLDDIRLSEAR